MGADPPPKPPPKPAPVPAEPPAVPDAVIGADPPDPPACAAATFVAAASCSARPDGSRRAVAMPWACTAATADPGAAADGAVGALGSGAEPAVCAAAGEVAGGHAAASGASACAIAPAAGGVTTTPEELGRTLPPVGVGPA